MAVIAARAVAALAAVALWAAVARAQPARTSQVLRDANTAAVAGDWQRVAALVDPLLRSDLPVADIAEAHRLAGIAAFFAQRNSDAETHFLEYLRFDLDGRLDPALYPPDVIAFFTDVASRHAAELRARRTRLPHRSWVYTLLPPIGQYQNGEHTKAYVLGGTLGALLIANLTTYAYIRSWCDHTDGSAGGALTCTDGPGSTDATAAAQRLRPINIASGIAFWVVYAWGVYDGISGYRRVSREQALQPYVTASSDSHVVGVMGHF